MSESPREKVGAILACVVVILPGMIISGFMPEIDVLPLWVWVAIAAVGSAIGGALWEAHQPVLGAACGALFGALALLLVPVYVDLRSGLSSTYWNFEFVIPLGVGVLPSAALYKWLRRPDHSVPIG
jgi:hypothetical protein